MDGVSGSKRTDQSGGGQHQRLDQSGMLGANGPYADRSGSGSANSGVGGAHGHGGAGSTSSSAEIPGGMLAQATAKAGTNAKAGSIFASMNTGSSTMARGIIPGQQPGGKPTYAGVDPRTGQPVVHQPGVQSNGYAPATGSSA